MNVKEREAKHNDGSGAKYTRSRRPIRIIYVETLRSLSAARKREALVKTWSKSEKEKLVLKKSNQKIRKK